MSRVNFLDWQKNDWNICLSRCVALETMIIRNVSQLTCIHKVVSFWSVDQNDDVIFLQEILRIN